MRLYTCEPGRWLPATMGSPASEREADQERGEREVADEQANPQRQGIVDEFHRVLAGGQGNSLQGVKGGDDWCRHAIDIRCPP